MRALISAQAMDRAHLLIKIFWNSQNSINNSEIHNEPSIIKVVLCITSFHAHFFFASHRARLFINRNIKYCEDLTIFEIFRK